MKKIRLTIRIPYSITGNRLATHSVVCKVDDERIKEVTDMLVDVCSMLEFDNYSIDLFNEDLSNAHRILYRS